MLGTSWDLGKLPGYLTLHMTVIVHVLCVSLVNMGSEVTEKNLIE